MNALKNSKPTCLGFIMDGNRRWAKEQNLPTLEGHQKGLDVFLDVVRFVRDEEIPHAVFYAFSTENWKRAEAEVSYFPIPTSTQSQRWQPALRIV